MDPDLGRKADFKKLSAQKLLVTHGAGQALMPHADMCKPIVLMTKRTM